MEKTVLITGSSGFVGPYLRAELVENGYKVVGVDRSGGSEFQADLLDAESLAAVMQEVVPGFICHLAGFSSVRESFDKPEICKRVNVEGTKNLLESVKSINPKARILIVTSSHVYGKPVHNPINEEHSLNPNSPYGESRVEQEELVLSSGLDVVISRSFNHTGPGQQLGFVCPDFIHEVRQVAEGKIEKVKVGNLSAERDMSDVRDVVVAYRVLLEQGLTGEKYNVCSGKPISIQSILDRIAKLADVDSSKVEQDPEKFRPVDVPIMFGDNSKVKELGWKPSFEIEKTLADMWNYDTCRFK